MFVSALIKWIVGAFKRLDDRLSDATFQHGRYCISDAKLPRARLSPVAARAAAHAPAAGRSRP